jgi:hypothetical protein
MITKKDKPKLTLFKKPRYNNNGYYIEFPSEGENVVWKCSTPTFSFSRNQFNGILGRLEMEPLYLNLTENIHGDRFKWISDQYKQGKKNITIVNVRNVDGEIELQKTLLVGAFVRDMTVNQTAGYENNNFESNLQVSITILYDAFVLL